MNVVAKPPMPGAHGPAVPGYPPQMAPQPVPPMAQSQPQQQPRQQTMTPAKSTIVFGDVDLEAIPAVYKREGPDYLALYVLAVFIQCFKPVCLASITSSLGSIQNFRDSWIHA
jgi:hypothetical protein